MKRHLKELVLLLAVFGGLPFDVMTDSPAYAATQALRVNGIKLGANDTGVYATAVGAVADGTTDSSSIIAAAVASLPSAGGTVYLPSSSAGNYRFNVTIAAKSSVKFVCLGPRRTTTIQPFTNAAVFTLDSTSGSMQGVTIEDCSFTAGTSTSPAISIIGTNINDWHAFRRLFFSGFTNTISITGRTIWSTFDNIEISGDLARGFVVTGTAVVNDLYLKSVRVANSASDGIYFNCTGGTQSVYADIILDGVNSEGNGGNGIVGTNVDGFSVFGSYIENNGVTSSALLFNGTWARALDIHGNYIQGQAHGFNDTATLTTGSVKSNYFADTTDNLVLTTTHADSHVEFGSNYDTTGAVVTVDVNGLSHFSSTSPLAIEYNSESTNAPSARNKNTMVFVQAGDITITNLANAVVGQLMAIGVIGAGSVTLTNLAGGAGQFAFSVSADRVLSPGSSILLRYDGGTWREMDRQAASTVGRNTITYSASMTPDASLGEVNVITATNSTAFAINAPLHPALNQKLMVQIRNTSGGALGTATWNAAFKMSTWTQPATANSRAITFVYNGTNWVEVSRTAADVPN